MAKSTPADSPETALIKAPQDASAVTAAAPLILPPAAAPAAVPAAASTLSWRAWLALIWFAGALAVLGMVMLGYLSLWSLERRSTPFNAGEWPELLRQLSAELGVRRRVVLLQSARRSMPMTWGLFQTRLLLPEEATNWTLEQRRAVLLHELGHVRRSDCLAQLVAQMACAIDWFNPLAWVAWHRMQIERERACDDRVLNSGARASGYAEHLLHSAAVLPALRFVGAAVAMARPSTLEERLRAILDPRRNRRTMSIKWAVATLILLMAALVPVAAVRGQENPAREPAAGETTPPMTRPPATGPVARSGRGVTRGGFAQAPALPAPATATPVPGEGPTCTLDATIYDVRLPVDKIGQLDVEALTSAAGTAVDFEKALAALGTSQPLYRASQAVRLSGDSILISTETPYITNSQVTTSGQTINSVAYRQMGAIFNVAGRTIAPDKIELDLSIQVSSLAEGATPIAGTVKAPVFRSATLAHKAPVAARKPFVVVSVDAASVDANGKAVAYIARITLGPPITSPASPP